MIGAGVGLIGSLFGKKKKQEEVVNRVDYARMVKDAEAAGFNPLTALRNGGAAGFSVTSQPVLSSTHAAIGEAIGGIGNFIANFDPFEDKMREVQYGIAQQQLKNLQSDAAFKASSRMFDPVAVSGRRKVTAGPSLAVQPLPERFGRSMTPDVVSPEVVNPAHGSWGWEVDPNMPNAEAWEDRYGDFVGSFLGSAATLGADGWRNAKRYLRDLPMPPVLGRLYHGDKRPRLRRTYQ